MEKTSRPWSPEASMKSLDQKGARNLAGVGKTVRRTKEAHQEKQCARHVYGRMEGKSWLILRLCVRPEKQQKKE
ncbi:MAG: hypothetical protein SOU94_04085 [Acidaminococcus sp.]|uniref:Uncharacterized protein n=1 Tax=Acidaminococcus intestini TaxID=187327 RepID=A0A943ELH4_9FIRM|nr:hypothetical protein [Acidaminococcus sp.]MBS5520082.1 hypothetical protein [Acidaminococcus intestini]MDY2738993.1 hypothetical protein [Acidaminococcus sp.]